MNDYQTNFDNEVEVSETSSAKKTVALVLAIIGIALAVIGMFSNCCLAIFGYILCIPALVVSIIAVVLKNKLGIVGIGLSVLGLVITILNSILGALLFTIPLL